VVVTSFVFRTVPAPPTAVFHLAWPLDRAADLVEAWQEWAPAGPDELDATLRLRAPGSDAPPRADVFGAFLGGETDAVDSLHDLIARARVEPDAAQHRLLGYRAAKRTLEEGGLLEDGGEQTPPDSRHDAGELLTKSEFFRRLLPRDTITALVANLIDGEASAYLREVTFLPWGGAYNRKRADATAFPHRDELFLVQHLLELTPTPPRTTATPVARGSRGRGRNFVPGALAGSMRTSLIRISRTGSTLTSERTTTASWR
jgi:hypothetical protein